MRDEDKIKAIAISKDMRADLRHLLEKHSLPISLLSANDDDPHTPVISCVQLALAQVSLEYLITSGCTPQEATSCSWQAMTAALQQWANGLIRLTEAK